MQLTLPFAGLPYQNLLVRRHQNTFRAHLCFRRCNCLLEEHNLVHTFDFSASLFSQISHSVGNDSGHEKGESRRLSSWAPGPRFLLLALSYVRSTPFLPLHFLFAQGERSVAAATTAALGETAFSAPALPFCFRFGTAVCNWGRKDERGHPFGSRPAEDICDRQLTDRSSEASGLHPSAITTAGDETFTGALTPQAARDQPTHSSPPVIDITVLAHPSGRSSSPSRNSTGGLL